MKVTDEGDIDLVGDYVLQSRVEGICGRIHISRQSKTQGSPRYKVKGSIQYEGSEREIDLSFIESSGRFIADTEYYTYVEMGPFYDSVFLRESPVFNDEEGNKDLEDKFDIFISGQFVKEEAHEENDR